MRISVPKLLRSIDLADYAPELVHPDGKPIMVWVWVNPPRDLMDRRRRNLQMGADAYRVINDAVKVGDQPLSIDERRRLLNDLLATGNLMAAWFAEIWSQADDAETHWSTEDVLSLGTNQTDPALYPWLQIQTMDLITAHRDAEKKRPLTP